MPWLVKFVTYWSQPDIRNFQNIFFEMMALVNNLDEINNKLHKIRSISNRKTKVENSECTRIYSGRIVHNDREKEKKNGR